MSLPFEKLALKRAEQFGFLNKLNLEKHIPRKKRYKLERLRLKKTE